MAFQSKTYTCGDAGGVRKLLNLTGPWQDVALPTNGIPGAAGSALFDVETDPTNGDKVFVVGEGACGSNWYGIAVSNNGGAFWQVPTGNYQNLVNNPTCYYKWNEVCVVDSNTSFVCGIVSGKSAIIAKSTDGGASFTICGAFPSTVDFMNCTAIHFISSLVGVAAFDDYILKTLDGGASWIVLNSGNSFASSGFGTGQITGIHLSTDGNTIVATGPSRIIRSSNGGSTFSSVMLVSQPNLFHLTSFGNSNIFITGYNDTAIYSGDAGLSWGACPYGLPNGLPSNGPVRIAAHYYKMNLGTPEGFYSGGANIYNTLNSICVNPLPAVSETSPYGITAVWTWYNEEPAPRCYHLTNCTTGEIIVTSTDLSSNIDQVVQLDDYEGCWLVSGSIQCEGSIEVGVEAVFENCEACVPACYRLIQCVADEKPVSILTSTNLSAYLGLVIQLSEYPGICWTVERDENCDGAQPLSSTITSQFVDCEACTAKCFKLIDCTGKQKDIITSTDLTLYEGKVIKIEGCPDVCYMVTSSDTCEGAVSVSLVSFFETCDICLNIVKPDIILKPRSVWPNYGNDKANCSIEYVEKINCEFGDQVFNKIIGARFGIKSCAQDNYIKYWVKKHLLDLDLIHDPSACKTADCCAPCVVTAELNIHRPLECPAVSNVTVVFTSPIECAEVTNITTNFFFNNPPGGGVGVGIGIGTPPRDIPPRGF